MIIFDIHFTTPIFLYVLPVILIIFYFLYYFINKKNTQKFLFIDDIKKVFWSFSFLYYFELFLLLLIIITFFLLFANPHKVNVEQKVKKNGIDIVFAFDVSGSMEAKDILPSRLEWAKWVIVQFLDKLKTDRVWLVVFAWRPYSSIPLTFDYNILKETFSNLSTSVLNQRTSELNWTAIWDAILMAWNLFKNKGIENEDNDIEREKIIILITDWDATKWVDPILASKWAKKDWIKIYTIWVWSEKGYIDRMYRIPPMNDKNLKEIAKISDWNFYRVTDNNTLKTVFKDLEKLEKNDIEIEVKKSYTEYYNIFLYTLIFLFMIYMWFKSIIFRR